MSVRRRIQLLADTKITLYRGETAGTGQQGNFYSPDREFARQFTQQGLDSEVKSVRVINKLIFKPDTPVFAGHPEAVDAAIIKAKQNNCKAVWLSEGQGEPMSVFIFDKSLLRQIK